mgnify:CR=1 FL=1|jgi:hypothetical protein
MKPLIQGVRSRVAGRRAYESDEVTVDFWLDWGGGDVHIVELALLTHYGGRATLLARYAGDDVLGIYDDGEWMENFRSELRSLGFPAEALDDFDYSEQGAQSTWQVDMDAGPTFAAAWRLLTAGNTGRFVCGPDFEQAWGAWKRRTALAGAKWD